MHTHGAHFADGWESGLKASLDPQSINLIFESMVRNHCNEADCPTQWTGRDISDIDRIRYIYQHLPAAKYVTDQLIGFIFSTELYSSNEMTRNEYNPRELIERLNKFPLQLLTKRTIMREVRRDYKKRLQVAKLNVNEKNTDRLQDFLQSINSEGVKNIDLLRKAVLESLVYGDAGIRFLSEEEGVVHVPSATYKAIYLDSEKHFGVKDVVAYAINIKGNPIGAISDEILEHLKHAEYEVDSNGVIKFKDTDIILISPTHFVAIENVPIEGINRSPLLNDTSRINLLLNVYNQLNHDVVYDGPGRILAWFDGKDYDMSAGAAGSALLDNTDEAKIRRKEEVRDRAKKFMKDVKHSKSNDLLINYGLIKEDPLFLPRTTKATEFLNFISDEVQIVCQIYGVPPQLLGVGDIVGNISMEMIILNAMVNVIIPLRQRYASKLSTLLSHNLNIGEVKFHAENYADKARYDDANILSLVAHRLAQSDNKEASEEVANRLLEVLEGRAA